MEQLATHLKEINTSNFSTETKNVIPVDIDYELSREKAIKKLTSVNIGNAQAIPNVSRAAIDMLYRLHMKIGATNQLPEDVKHSESYLKDLWVSIYLKNNKCPGDIPFPIIMEEFIEFCVQNNDGRKGNNHAAICSAFNSWVTQEANRNKLYQIRNDRYPSKAPKQLESKSRNRKITHSDDELLLHLKNIPNLSESELANRMFKEYSAEAERRGLTY